MSKSLWLQQKLTEKHTCRSIGLNHPSNKSFRRISNGQKSPKSAVDESANYVSSVLLILVEAAPHVLIDESQSMHEKTQIVSSCCWWFILIMLLFSRVGQYFSCPTNIYDEYPTYNVLTVGVQRDDAFEEIFVDKCHYYLCNETFAGRDNTYDGLLADNNVLMNECHNVLIEQYDKTSVDAMFSYSLYGTCKKSFGVENWFNHSQFPQPKSKKRRDKEGKENRPPKKKHKQYSYHKRGRKYRLGNLNKVDQNMRIKHLKYTYSNKVHNNTDDVSDIEMHLQSCNLQNNNNHNNICMDYDEKNDNESDWSDWDVDEADGIIDKSSIAQYLHNSVIINAPKDNISGLTYQQRQRKGITFDGRACVGEKITLSNKQSTHPTRISLSNKAMSKLSKMYMVCPWCSKNDLATEFTPKGNIQVDCRNCCYSNLFVVNPQLKISGKRIRGVQGYRWFVAVNNIICGVSFKQYCINLQEEGRNPMCQDKWIEIKVQLEALVEKLFADLRDNCVIPLIHDFEHEIGGQSLLDLKKVCRIGVGQDAGWQRRGRKACSLDGVTYTTHIGTRYILSYACMHRDTPSRSRSKRNVDIFEQSSTQMDPEGSKQCLKEIMCLAKGRFDVVLVLADGHTSLFQELRDLKLKMLEDQELLSKYPHLNVCIQQVLREYCTGHIRGCLDRAIASACTQWKKVTDKGSMARYCGVDRIKKYIKTAYTDVAQDADNAANAGKTSQAMIDTLDHLDKNSTHKSTLCRKRNCKGFKADHTLKLPSDLVKYLKLKLKKYYDKDFVSKMNLHWTNNRCESLHWMGSCLNRKDKFWGRVESYKLYCGLTAIRANHGWCAYELIFERMGMKQLIPKEIKSEWRFLDDRNQHRRNMRHSVKSRRKGLKKGRQNDNVRARKNSEQLYHPDGYREGPVEICNSNNSFRNPADSDCSDY
eukprot:427615_1